VEYIFGGKMDFGDFFCFKAIIPELESRDRDGVISELVKALEKAGCLGKGGSQPLIKAVIKRENEASTGMGKGVAVPHVKSEAVSSVVAAIGQSSKGIDFRSLDKQPVYSVVLLISPKDKPDKHLEAMEKVFKHLQQDKFRKFLRQSRTVEQITELLEEADNNAFL
jgi:mannitol/fructose-specific phosphotransferase system IIA component (Ntr-type)